MADYVLTLNGEQIEAALAWADAHKGVNVTSLSNSVKNLQQLNVQVSATADKMTLTYSLPGGTPQVRNVPVASATTAGVITAEEKRALGGMVQGGVLTINAKYLTITTASTRSGLFLVQYDFTKVTEADCTTLFARLAVVDTQGQQMFAFSDGKTATQVGVTLVGSSGFLVVRLLQAEKNTATIISTIKN